MHLRIAHGAGNRRQGMKMRGASLLRRKQAEHQFYRHAVCRVERDGRLEPKKGRHGAVQSGQARMRNRHAAAKTGAAQLFAFGDPAQHSGRVQTVHVGETASQLIQNGWLGFGAESPHRFGEEGEQYRHDRGCLAKIQ